jgi:GGDEF domain-containing protein
MLTLGGLKAVRSALGPLEHDLILARVGRLLEHKCRRSNLLARYDEYTFALLMPETRPEQAQVLAQRLGLWVEADPILKERCITGNFGLASCPLDGPNPEDLLKRACQPNGLAVTTDIHISSPR